MDPGKRAELLEMFRLQLQARLPADRLEAVFDLALQTFVRARPQPRQSTDQILASLLPDLSIEDLIDLEEVTDCIGAFNLRNPNLTEEERFRPVEKWKSDALEECTDRFMKVPKAGNNDTDCGNTEHEEAAQTRIDLAQADAAQIAVAANGGKAFLTSNEVEEICRDVVAEFFSPVFLTDFVFEGSARIVPQDIKDLKEIRRRLDSEEPLARYLSSLASLLTATDQHSTREQAHPPGVAAKDPLLDCLSQLNALIEDDDFHPDAPEKTPSPTDGPSASTASFARTLHAQLLRRRHLEYFFGGALSPRQGFCPKRGCLRDYLISGVFSRIHDAIRRAVKKDSVSRRSDCADSIPGILTSSIVPDVAGLLQLVLDSGQPTHARWAEQLSNQGTPPKRYAPLLRAGTLAPSPLAEAFLRDLSQLIASTPVFTAEDVNNPALPPRLRGLCSAWHALTFHASKEQDPKKPSKQTLTAFNRLALRLCFPALVRPEIALIPHPTLKDHRLLRSIQKDDDGLFSHSQELLKDTRFSAILDLFLAARIPPEAYGSRTLKALEIGLTPSNNERDPSHLPELLQMLRLEYAHLNREFAYLARELVHAEALFSQDLADLEHALGQISLLTSECILQLADRLDSTWDYGLEQLPHGDGSREGRLHERRQASVAGSQDGSKFLLALRRATKRCRTGKSSLREDKGLFLEGLIRRITEAVPSRAFSEATLRAAVKSLDLNPERSEVLTAVVLCAHALYLSWGRQGRIAAKIERFRRNDGQWVRSETEIGIWFACHQSTIHHHFTEHLPETTADQAELFTSHVLLRTGTRSGISVQHD